MSVEDSLALKYRPKKLSDIIGQPVVVKAFSNAFKYNTLHHVYILEGAKGSGKTSVARIVAATENCKKGGKDPCGKCSNCVEILKGKSIEVNEIDGASNGSVEDIRGLRKELYQCPMECRTKYIIIDEAHDLSKKAQDSALKMIEEPPKFVKFILCTTEAQAIIPTIHSRCIVWKFNKVNWIEMIPLLEKVCKEEKIIYEESSLPIITKYAKGSVRDALKNLHTVLNYNGKETITALSVREALGVIDEKLYFDLIEGIINCNVISCFKSIETMLKDGKEARIVIDGLYEHLNNILIAKSCPNDLSSFTFSDLEIKRYSYQASKIKGDMILIMLNLMNHIAFGIEYSLNPQVLFNKFALEAILAEKKSKKEIIEKKGKK